jgi:hypothetical protein
MSILSAIIQWNNEVGKRQEEELLEKYGWCCLNCKRYNKKCDGQNGLLDCCKLDPIIRSKF